MTTVLSWLVLALVFLAELVALAALFVAGLEAAGWWLGLGLALGAAALWGLFAAPKARSVSPVAGLLTKTAVFGGAVAGLWWAGHRPSTLVFGVLVVIVHALAALPGVRAVRADGT